MTSAPRLANYFQRCLPERVLTGVLALVNEELVDLVAGFALGELDIVLGGAVVGHEGEETVVSYIELQVLSAGFQEVGHHPWQTHKLVLSTADVGDVHVVSGRAQFFELLVGEDVDGNQVDLGVTVLAGLGGGHLDNLAGTVLDDDETVLPQSRALHGVGQGGTGIGALEGVLMLYTMRSASVRWMDLCASRSVG